MVNFVSASATVQKMYKIKCILQKFVYSRGHRNFKVNTEMHYSWVLSYVKPYSWVPISFRFGFSVNKKNCKNQYHKVSKEIQKKGYLEAQEYGQAPVTYVILQF